MDAMVCIELVWKNQTINPFFFFFYECGSKRTLLGILVVLGSFRLDWSCFGWFCGWFGVVWKLSMDSPNF